MKKITLLLCLVIGGFTMTAQEIVFEDSFDSYTDFAISGVGAWTLTDVDGLGTYGFNGLTFPDNFSPKSFQVFNNTATNPPLDPTADSDWTARTGTKAMVCFASVPSLGQGNDDWLISPQITLGTGGSTLSFWYKATDGTYSSEEFTVGVSTTGAAPGDFTVISANPEQVTNGGLVYLEFTADLTAYEGNQIYIGINCISFDQFGLMVDDFVVTSQSLSTTDFNALNFNYFVDTNNTLNLSANETLSSIKLYNLLGQEVMSKSLSNQNESVDINALNSGVYLAQVQINANVETFKFVKK